MTTTGAIVCFVIVWWLCLFVVLPIGVRGQYEDGSTVAGTEAGAPQEPMIRKKAIWATWGAAVITAFLFVLTRVIDVQTLVVGS